ncbi:MAG: cytochrome c [Hyphomicrobiaceae bacterium]
MKRLTFLLLAPMLAVVALAAPDARLLAKGQAILDKICSRCHSIGKDGASPHEKAPPFRTVVTRYPAETLAEALAEGLVSGHPDMPEFTFEPTEIDAIIAYLDSLGRPVKK